MSWTFQSATYKPFTYTFRPDFFISWFTELLLGKTGAHKIAENVKRKYFKKNCFCPPLKIFSKSSTIIDFFNAVDVLS
jgi:hypothetical protein